MEKRQLVKKYQLGDKFHYQQNTTGDLPANYQYELISTPQGAYVTKHAEFNPYTQQREFTDANQEYWGNKGGGSVARGMHEAAGNIFNIVKQPAYFVPVVGNAVLAGDVVGQVLNKDYTGAATTLATVGALKYGTPLAIKGGKQLVDKIKWNRMLKNPELNNLTSHRQGEEAVKMFKEYGGTTPINPEQNINYQQIKQYVPEARERYGLIGNNNVTDEEIAQALYKHSKELGENTAAVNAQGEPQLLFRGDTQRYTQLKERMSPEELATKSGTMDNSLGNLFLGELPGTAGKRTRGLERYLVTGREFRGNKVFEGSGTGSRAVMPDGTFAPEWGNTVSEFPEGSQHLVTYNTKYGPNTYYKLPASYSESGVNDINAFVVRTPQMRDASREVSVLNDDFIIKGGPKVEYHGPIRKEVLNKDGFPLIVDEKGNVVAHGSSDRQAMAQHYRYVLNDAKNKKQGLLKSSGETDGTPGNYLRDEHDDYSYFALPNFNIQGAKHLLPYDLRLPRNWNSRNIYKSVVPTILTTSALYQTNKGEQ